MNCEKCQDKGFTEEEHGLTVILCDCDKAREVAEAQGIPISDYIPPEAIESIEISKDLEEALNDNTSIGRTESANQSPGSPGTSQPKRTKKSKAKKRARARTS